MASPTPVLPLVGSTITPPGCNRPSRSAASIIVSAGRSFELPPGFIDSSFTRHRPPREREAVESDQRRLADEVQERVGHAHVSTLI